MRHLIGSGTPRGLQDRPATVIAAPEMVRWFPSPITLLSRDHFHHGLLGSAIKLMCGPPLERKSDRSHDTHIARFAPYSQSCGRSDLNTSYRPNPAHEVRF
jgi:hypothetical protein